MPAITSTIHAHLGVISEEWRGDVTADELARHWRRAFTDAGARRFRRSLVDLRDARFQFSGEELSHLIVTVVLPSLEGLEWRTAFVVAQPVQYGIARQYQAFASDFSTDHIFTERDAALVWLREGRVDSEVSMTHEPGRVPILRPSTAETRELR